VAAQERKRETMLTGFKHKRTKPTTQHIHDLCSAIMAEIRAAPEGTSPYSDLTTNNRGHATPASVIAGIYRQNGREAIADELATIEKRLGRPLTAKEFAWITRKKK